MIRFQSIRLIFMISAFVVIADVGPSCGGSGSRPRPEPPMEEAPDGGASESETPSVEKAE